MPVSNASGIPEDISDKAPRIKNVRKSPPVELPGTTAEIYRMAFGNVEMGIYAPTKKPMTAEKMPEKAPLAEVDLIKLIMSIMTNVELVTETARTPIQEKKSTAVR